MLPSLNAVFRTGSPKCVVRQQCLAGRKCQLTTMPRPVSTMAEDALESSGESNRISLQEIDISGVSVHNFMSPYEMPGQDAVWTRRDDAVGTVWPVKVIEEMKKDAIEDGKKRKRWTHLQMPFYCRLSVRHESGTCSSEACNQTLLNKTARD